MNRVYTWYGLDIRGIISQVRSKNASNLMHFYFLKIVTVPKEMFYTFFVKNSIFMPIGQLVLIWTRKWVGQIWTTHDYFAETHRNTCQMALLTSPSDSLWKNTPRDISPPHMFSWFPSDLTCPKIITVQILASMAVWQNCVPQNIGPVEWSPLATSN